MAAKEEEREVGCHQVDQSQFFRSASLNFDHGSNQIDACEKFEELPSGLS